MSFILTIKNSSYRRLVFRLNKSTIMKVLIVLGVFTATTALPWQLTTMAGGGRIVGGEKAERGEFPYMLALYKNGYFICGASLIDRNWCVTAAHCVYRANAAQFVVLAGDHNRSDDSPGKQKLQVRKIIVHQQYNPNLLYNDIALLEVDSATINNFVDKIALPKADVEPAHDKCTVTGWGTFAAGGSLPSVLQKVNVTIMSHTDCKAAYSKESIPTSMMCAGHPAGGKDSCQGDSGGPLASTGIIRTLVGIVSWGYGCAEPGYPGVYTNVVHYVNWIMTYISN